MQPAPARISMTAERAWVLLGFLLVSLAFSASQPVAADEGQGYGGQAYHAMAKAMPRELPPQGVAPYVYRWGTPLVAAGLAKSQDWVIAAGFDRLNFAFNALSVLLLTILLQRHVPSLLARLLVVTAFVVEPHSPVRLSYVHPLSVDPSAMAGLLAGLIGIEWFHARPSPRRAVLLAVLVSAGVMFHEAMLVIAVCVLFMPPVEGRAAGWRERFAALESTGAWLPVVAGAATLAAVHAWIVPTPSGFSMLDEALRWLGEKSPIRYGLAWFMVFGPLLIAPLYFRRTAAAFLRTRPAMLVYLLAFALIAWVGDGETERLLAFASPVVYLLIASALPIDAMSASFTVGVVAMQALSSRVPFPVGGPIAPPEVRAEVWERLVSPNVAWALSYQNMWSQWCAPSMVTVYSAWYAVTGGIIAFLWSRPQPWPPRAITRGRGLWPRVWSVLRTLRLPVALTVLVATLAAISPVVWLAISRFYWSHYAQPGPGYLPYNLARVWLVAALLFAFWATGSRICGLRASSSISESWRREHAVDLTFCGAAVWSVAIVVLAMLHLYYVWAVVAALAVAVALGVADLVNSRPVPSPSGGRAVTHRWGLAGILLRLILATTAVAVLISIALPGHFGGDNDVPGNYLPYYETVLQEHTNAPGRYWVHFFASKGNGLAFLTNALSDVQGAALATFLMLLLGAGMLWRFAGRLASAGPVIGLVGACLYLQYYAGQGAYAKPHIIRNTFLLYLILSGVYAIYRQEWHDRLHATARLAVITAVVVLSPLAIVLLVPIVLMEAWLTFRPRTWADARHALLEPTWALATAVLVCGYNYLQVGLFELHNMPSFMGRLVDVERFSRWIDPVLVYLDYRLAFVEVALPGARPDAASAMTFTPTQSLAQVLSALLNPAALSLIGGAVVTGMAAYLWRDRHATTPEAPSRGMALSLGHLVFVLGIIAGLQLFGGGPGSSMGRFTDFATPIGIAIGVMILALARTVEMPRSPRLAVTALVAGTASISIALASSSVLALPWRASTEFLLGQRSYAALNETFWDTLTGYRIARSLPADARVEMVNFLPGFTAVPATPFQRPDGCLYLKDYSKVLYGTPDETAAIYAGYGIDYFLFDVSDDAPVVWSGFSSLFAPESMRSRMQLVAHEVSGSRQLYLLTWRRDAAPGDDAAFDTFLGRWGSKLALEKAGGYFYGPYAQGLHRTGRSS